MPLLVLFISLRFFHFVVKPPREGYCTTVRLDHRLQGLRMPISSSWAGVRGSRVVGYRVKCGVDPLSFFRWYIEKRRGHVHVGFVTLPHLLASRCCVWALSLVVSSGPEPHATGILLRLGRSSPRRFSSLLAGMGVFSRRPCLKMHGPQPTVPI